MGFWKILGIIFLVLIISLFFILIIGGFILYNYVPFHIVSFCVYDEGVSIPIQCSTNIDCQNNLNGIMNFTGGFVNMPDDIEKKLSPVIEESISCVEGVCFVRKILLIGGEGIVEKYIGNEVPKAKSCEGKKIEISAYGKEIWKFYKDNKDKINRQV
ncbi:MAG: hypothetical protein AABW91_01100 [Nanoarchaeota archaeon]|mgnify:CR=1 FL=1